MFVVVNGLYQVLILRAYAVEHVLLIMCLILCCIVFVVACVRYHVVVTCFGLIITAKHSAVS